MCCLVRHLCSRQVGIRHVDVVPDVHLLHSADKVFVTCKKTPKATRFFQNAKRSFKKCLWLANSKRRQFFGKKRFGFEHSYVQQCDQMFWYKIWSKHRAKGAVLYKAFYPKELYIKILEIFVKKMANIYRNRHLSCGWAKLENCRYSKLEILNMKISC
jgi:hypothetical protein